MKRTILASLLVVVLTAPAAYGQAKLLPPVSASHADPIKPVQHLELPLPSGPTVLGPPTSLPPAIAVPVEVPATAPPHQMQGREPAHGTATAGTPKTPPQPPVMMGSPAFSVPEVIGPVGRFWAELDTLVWWVSGDKPPALLTTSPLGTPQSLAGVLGNSSTTVLAGGREFNDAAQAGFRLNIGYWIDSRQTFGIQAGGIWLVDNNSQSSFSSGGGPILARPFFDVTTNKQNAELIGFPGVSSGAVIVTAHSSMDGWDVALRQNAACFGNGRIDAVLGYRQLRLADDLGIGENVTVLGAGGLRGLPVGTNLVAIDRFDTVNDFYGAEFGFVGEYCYHGLVVEGLVKLAAGWNVNYFNTNGVTFLTPSGLPTTTNTGGTLALASNIGQFRHTVATFVPECGLNLAYDLTCHVRLRGGYTVLYWDHVSRPGQQIDTGINPSFLPPGLGGSPVRPLPTLGGTDLFMHGMNFGVEVRY